MRSGRNLAALALGLAACLGGGPTGPETEGPGIEELPPNALQVLFIGNSLTYADDLPGVVAAMARATNQHRLPGFTVHAAPDFNLEDHWRFGAAEQLLRQFRWDVVVLQQAFLPAGKPGAPASVGHHLRCADPRCRRRTGPLHGLAVPHPQR